MDSNRPRKKLCVARALVIAICLLALPGIARGESPKDSKPDYASQFPRKADSAGNPLPAKQLVIRLDASRRFTLPIRAVGVCYAGDLLMILLEAGWGKFKHVLISLEPVLDSQPAGSSEKLVADQLGNGKIAANLVAPRVSAPTPMGLFICKDSAGTGRCRDKPLTPLDQIFGRYSDREKAEKLDPQKDIPDTIYFFTPVIVGPDAITASDAVFDSAERARIAAVAKSAGPESEASQVVARIEEIQSGRNSSPLLELGGTPTLVLPMLDQSKCK